MSSVSPSKAWMKAYKPGPDYCAGVASFLKFASNNSGGIDWYLCPCVKCKNVGRGLTLLKLEEHLVCNGIMQSYTTWYCHGESYQTADTNHGENSGACTSRDQEEQPRMFDLVNDVLRHVEIGQLDACIEETNSREEFQNYNDHNGNNQPEDMKAKKMKEDASQPLYTSCRVEDTKLSVVVELVGIKSMNNWSDNSFDELLKMLKRTYPVGNSLPDNTRDCLQMIKSLGMDYKTIHSCPNACILYRKEHANSQSCPTCKVGRYKPEFLNRNSRVPKKVLRYFPLTPRLQRLYSVPWIAKMMKWHSESTPTSGCMRHPVDSSCWKGIDVEYPEFSAEPRNVRLGLSTDGFNPFGNKNISYSCWPVMIVPYNLPPSFCMSKEFTMLSLLIPGKHSPGTNIDVYLQPLIDELNELWGIGSAVYDSYHKNIFNMRAILLWTIQDFPALGYISGCRTAGKYACPVCGEQIYSIRIRGKQSYMGHRCFLSVDHLFRKQKSQFNGQEEHGKAPRRLTGEEVYEKVKNLRTQFGKVLGKKRKNCENDDEGSTAWSKKSIFFELPYWKSLLVRHNLDVMHVEKNVTENLLATIMGTKDKTKDGLQARMDLKDMNIRKNMWPIQDGNRTLLPTAPFLLSRAEREVICQTIQMLKVPIGYSSNWRYNVSLEDLQIKCPKSHDYHIIIQQLLPVMLMHAYKKQKPLGAAIRQLSIFFNVLCSKVIRRDELEVASRKIVEVLCVFEKYFPPAFFVSMTHLVVHLAEEARICGPVRFRWMYPFERMMRTYKDYVKNKRHPEGCIANRYLIEESILYCMEYMPNGRKMSHKRGRKTIIDNDLNSDNEQPVDRKGRVYKFSNLQYEQVRKWVLGCSDAVVEWREKYMIYQKNHPSNQKRKKGSAPVEKEMSFIPWLRKQLEKDEMSTLKRLVEGPSFKATSYKAYEANGYLFCTKQSESSKSTQNSGVTMKAMTSFRASSKDKNYVDGVATYYGVIKQILELDYYDFKQTVFYCDWVRIEDKVNGCYVDPETKLTFVNFRRFRSNLKEGDEPFILSSQASQVFYCKDSTRDDWHVVLDSPKRLTRDVDAYENPLVFDAQMNMDAFGTTFAGEVTNIEDNEQQEVSS